MQRFYVCILEGNLCGNKFLISFSAGARQEQDIFVRLIDSVTKQVRYLARKLRRISLLKLNLIRRQSFTRDKTKTPKCVASYLRTRWCAVGVATRKAAATETRPPATLLSLIGKTLFVKHLHSFSPITLNLFRWPFNLKQPRERKNAGGPH